jgi:hypothetical protein
MAPQLIATKGPSRRRLALCIACASNSLPVPDSPKMNTLASVAATRRALASTSCNAELRVMIAARQSSPSAGACAPTPSARARSTSSSRVCASKGLVR